MAQQAIELIHKCPNLSKQLKIELVPKQAKKKKSNTKRDTYRPLLDINGNVVNSLYFKCIPASVIDHDQVVKLFERYGPILRIEIKQSEYGEFGIVTFDNQQSGDPLRASKCARHAFYKLKDFKISEELRLYVRPFL